MQVLISKKGFSYYLVCLLLSIPFCFFSCSTSDSVTSSEPEYSPINAKILFKAYDGINTVDPDGSNLTKLIDEGNTPCWSPDGMKIAYCTSYRESALLMIMDSDGTDSQEILSYSEEFVFPLSFDPVWSSNGTKIIFIIMKVTESGAASDIYAVNADGTNMTDLTNNPGDYDCITWSPDNSTILFYSDIDGDNEIYKIAVDNYERIKLTDNSVHDIYPCWSPDGTAIVYSSSNKIYKMNSDGSNIVFLADGTYPVFSPDGSKIVYCLYSEDSRLSDVYTMNSDGSNSMQITYAGDKAILPKWSEDGSKIAFIRLVAAETGVIQSSDIYIIDSDGNFLNQLTTGEKISNYFWSPIY
ncbi:DUF5050 domain-containing protein [candidate division KSB1 bacterium]